MYFSGVDCFVEYNDVHMWNKVKLNGKWYKIDITNLDTITESR
jgi:transglutaminase/protease-like cytokinesis protein 3